VGIGARSSERMGGRGRKDVHCLGWNLWMMMFLISSSKSHVGASAAMLALRFRV
jgi:hypothetical protein